MPDASTPRSPRPEGPRIETLVVTAGRAPGPGQPLNVPLMPASTFTAGGEHGYARDDGTPTWQALETAVGALEGAEAVAFASGMAAIAAVFDLLPAGARIAWPDDCYQGVAGLVAAGEAAGRWTGVRVAPTDTHTWCQLVGSVDLVWLESPSNPLLAVADIDIIAAAPRPSTTLVAVDNTLAGSLGQRPLDLGADLAVQSATKQLGGHSDLLAGVVTSRRPDLVAGIRRHRALHGAVPGALEAYLATRGLRTLALRHTASERSASVLAERLAAHPAVELVRYPGLVSHPTAAAASRLLRGPGAVISFDVAGGADAADRVCGRLTTVRAATSFGAVESTIERRAALAGQEHLPPGLLRLSVGIEHVDDLWADLDRALAADDIVTGDPPSADESGTPDS
ncbi:MAG: trans-sulfuration enzyme family protein [Acidimicrobiales bacterium]